MMAIGYVEVCFVLFIDVWFGKRSATCLAFQYTVVRTDYFNLIQFDVVVILGVALFYMPISILYQMLRSVFTWAASKKPILLLSIARRLFHMCRFTHVKLTGSNI